MFVKDSVQVVSLPHPPGSTSRPVRAQLIDQTTSLVPPFTPQSNLHISHPVASSSPASQNGTPRGSQHFTPNTAPPLDSLPTITGQGNSYYFASDDIPAFLAQELDLSRLNKIHTHLWMAGRPMRARPLHRHKMLGFDILPTQQMDLHLLRFSHHFILKPLPEWLLSHAFWTDHLCSDAGLHASATGFLLSYVWLVTTPLDFKLAQEAHMMPEAATWSWWKAFVRDFFLRVDTQTLDQVNARYQFGELRLSRINGIYRTRFFFTHFVRGYLYGYNRYVAFFNRNFSWILIVFVFFSLVLSAMQVGTGLDEYNESGALLRSSYGFVLFSILAVVVLLGVVAVIFAATFAFNMVTAIRHAADVQKERQMLAENRKIGRDA